MKVCSKCGQSKPFEDFYKYPNKSDGLNARCKECIKVYKASYYQKNKDSIKSRVKENYWKNPEAKRTYQKDYGKENYYKIKVYRALPESRRRKSISDKKYYQKNKEKIKERIREWEQKNAEHVAQKKRNYQRNRRHTDLDFKLRMNLRRRLVSALKTKSKYKLNRAGSFVKDLGCNIPELKQHLEKQFQPGMTWDNWGKKGWHIDHIIPLSRFDLTDREQFLRACHYTNLQPLWWWENLQKFNH